MSERSEVNKRLRVAEGELQHHVDMFGDQLAKKMKYKNLAGIEAVWYYLVQKHNWTPATVRAFNTEDLRFLLNEEMSGRTFAEAKK